jgi:acetyl-CoA decarbonylase/synthase complex subunit delta
LEEKNDLTKEIEKPKNILESLDPRILALLSELGEVELEDVEMEMGHLEFALQQLPLTAAARAQQTPTLKLKPEKLLTKAFEPPRMEYSGKIIEVKIGAKKSDGGSRDRTITLGGETSPPYYLFENASPNPPTISIDVFDTKLHLARAVRMHVEDVMEDPCAWAKRAVDKWEADMINLHLISIDPLIKDASPKEASKTVESVIQAVKVPIAIGGCGDPEKDLAVFTKISEDFKGERLLFNSVTLDMDVKKITESIASNGHTLIAFTPMDMD